MKISNWLAGMVGAAFLVPVAAEAKKPAEADSKKASADQPKGRVVKKVVKGSRVTVEPGPDGGLRGDPGTGGDVRGDPGTGGDVRGDPGSGGDVRGRRPATSNIDHGPGSVAGASRTK